MSTVLLFHFFPTTIPFGYLGVDLFFSISGFVMYRLIKRDMDARSFSFITFYKKRILRLFPTLGIVLLSSLLAGAIILDQSELTALAKHTVAGVFFSSNFLLWSEAGYFDKASEFKPLLHLWSLGIEEQFYLAFPVLLLLLARIRNKQAHAVLLTLATASLGLHIYLSIENEIAAFYLPLTRIWEFLVGVFVAINYDQIANAIQSNTRSKSIGKLVSVLKASLESQPLHFLGLISYALYLWHWPILTFARIQMHGMPAAEIRVPLILTCVMLAYLTTRYFEAGIRHSSVRSMPVQLLSLLALIAIGAAILYFRLSLEGIAHRSNNGQISKEQCHEKYMASPCLMSSAEPIVQLMGDSHSLHLFDGMTNTTPRMDSILVGTCAPLLGAALKVDKNQAHHPCVPKRNYMKEKLQVLNNQRSLRFVILSTFWHPALTEEIVGLKEKDLWGGTQLVMDDQDLQKLSAVYRVEKALQPVIDRIHDANLRIILVRDTPFFEKELNEQCPSLKELCWLKKEDVLKSRVAENKFIRLVQSRNKDILIIDPLEAFCDETRCFIVRDTALFIDNHHLSQAGSAILAKLIKTKMNEHGWLP